MIASISEKFKKGRYIFDQTENKFFYCQNITKLYDSREQIAKEAEFKELDFELISSLCWQVEMRVDLLVKGFAVRFHVQAEDIENGFRYFNILSDLNPDNFKDLGTK